VKSLSYFYDMVGGRGRGDREASLLVAVMAAGEWEGEGKKEKHGAYGGKAV
jgi:hypothetical protein